MNLLELSELLLDEKKAEEYLLKVGILKTFTSCEKCGSNRITKISRGRHRCNSCLSEWNKRAGSILHGQSLSASKFLGLVKMFELELTAKDGSINMGVNLKTTKGVYHKIRLAVTETNNSDFDTFDKILKGENQEFLISIENGKVSIRVSDTHCQNGNLFSLVRTRTPSREASYSFKFSKMTSRNIERKLKCFPIGLNYFWRFARKRLLNYRGTNLKYLYLYLLEAVCRYNNREVDYYEIIVTKIASFEGW